MPFKISGGENYFNVKVYGELLIGNITEFKNEIRELVAKYDADGNLPFIFDMSTLRYIDSSGIGALIDLKKLFDANGISFAFYKVPRDIQRLIDMTRLTSYFPTFDTAEEAIEELI